MRRIACQGAPRDLGLDQGRACRAAIRSELLRNPGARTGAVQGELARDLARHFPHLAERLEGLARGAGVSRADLVPPLARALLGPSPLRFEARCEPSGADAAGSLLVLAAHDAPLRVREARPETGFPSLALVLPWLPAALAGVNEAGLAAACALEPSVPGAARAPAALLLEHALERFERVANALDWCERRPGVGAACLVFADAAGASGAIQVRGDERRRLPAPAGEPAWDGSALRIRIAPAQRHLRVGDAVFALGDVLD